MATLWTFGDSLTEGFKSNDKWAKTYVKWKGYTPKTYGEIIAEYLQYEIINLGRGGSDNYSIFETFCNNVSKFESDDIIIIGWSDVIRFRLNNKIGSWISLLPNHLNPFDDIDNISQNTIDEILVNRMSKVYIDEVNSWIKLINKLTKDFKIINWSAFNKGKLNCLYVSKTIESIDMETKGKILDGHFSEIGHVQLSEKLMSFGNIKKRKFI